MPNQPATPVGLNHLVLNVRNLEESHRFWTETIGFKQVGEMNATPARPNPPKMRFYSGDHGGGSMSHHDVALIENPNSAAAAGRMDHERRMPMAISHIAIAFQIARLGCAARISAGARREVQPPRRSRHDPQPLHQ